MESTKVLHHTIHLINLFVFLLAEWNSNREKWSFNIKNYIHVMRKEKDSIRRFFLHYSNHIFKIRAIEFFVSLHL